jgi:predicted Zn-dependent peptidase
MLSFLACALAIGLANPESASSVSARSGFRQDSTRLRSILPNGSVVFVEHVSRADKLILQLFVSTRSIGMSRGTNGFCHLLEHLTAPGRNRDVDQKLESQGAFLTAQTMRDAIVYQICLRPDDLQFGLGTLQSVMQLGETTADGISRECGIIRQEIALETDTHALSQAAWEVAYRDQGLDPLGDADVMATATPGTVDELHHRLFSGSNLTLVISGPVDLDAATEAAKNLLESAPSIPVENQVNRVFSGGGTSSADADGEALAVPVDSWNSPKTAARLAAALSIASNLKNSFVTYTPSLLGSLIVVGRTGQTSGLSQEVARLSGPGEFGIGRSLARAWVQRERSIQANNVLTGLLLSEGAGQKPETALENLDEMTVADFQSALDAFRARSTVVVIGK